MFRGRSTAPSASLRRFTVSSATLCHPNVPSIVLACLMMTAWTPSTPASATEPTQSTQSALPTPPNAPYSVEPVFSGGQPPRWRLGMGAMLGHDYLYDQPEGRLFLDTEGRVAMHQFGLLDLHLEGAVDFDQLGVGSAIGAYVKVPYLRVGVERDLDEGRYDLVLSVQGSARRGGMFKHGERLRVDYSPTRQRVQLGFVFNTPWSQYRRTRPFRIHVDLPRGETPKRIPTEEGRLASADLARVEHAIEWLDLMLTPQIAPLGYFSKKGQMESERVLAELKQHQRLPGHGFAAEDSAYHASLEGLFTGACAGDSIAGRRLASLAEATILQEVVIPFNQAFARPRSPDGIGGLAKRGQDRFEESLRAESPPLDEPSRSAAHEAFRRVVSKIDLVARAANVRWRSSSLAWLPCNYGLRPGAYDSQEKIEAVVGRVLGATFSHGNDIHYVLNDQFYYELQRSILAARQYHVLWIHDFRGVNAEKQPDRIAWSQATEGYIKALTEAIEGLDRGERADLPVFIVFLDQHYYQVNDSRRLISLLENLSTAEAPRLSDTALRDRLAGAMDRLQILIKSSAALRERGADYVKRRVRVQVYITYPMDPAFAGDILMRDHRKMAFYDVSETDPFAGGGIFTGEGVGEHYAGASWEDRSLVVHGPELLRLKVAARRLLASQGFKPSEVPGCLREHEPGFGVAALEARADALGWNTHLLSVMNETGWGAKKASILKAILYNLMAKGGCIIAPDSIWTNDFWAAMFVSAALRGCRVYVIAPAYEHAPSSALPTVGLMQETMAHLLHARRQLEPDLVRIGGDIHVGLYTRPGDVSDMRAHLEQLLGASGDYLKLFHGLRLDPRIYNVLQAEYDTLQHSYAGSVHPLSSEAHGNPQIHMKMQFFASREGLDIFSRPEWVPILARYLSVRRRQTSDPTAELEGISPKLLTAGSAGDSTGRAGDSTRSAGDSTGADVFQAYCDSLGVNDPERRNRVFYLATVGSHNQDRRGMLLDGEDLVAVSGREALVTALDVFSLLATATWIEREEDLEDYFPKSSDFMKSLRRLLRDQI